MKVSRRSLVVSLAVLLMAFFWLQKDREKNLPSGQVSETGIVDFPPVSPEPMALRPQVEIATSKGVFTLELRPDIAPDSVVNFLSKWSSGYCDNMTFHRVEDWVVQGCDPKGDGTGGNNTLKTENSSESFLAGSIGVARRAYPSDLSNDSQFFIVKQDSVFLDGEYTHLGRVISGMDVVNQLQIGDTILSTVILTK